MMYKAIRNNGGVQEHFVSFSDACSWVAQGDENYEKVENGPDSVYIFPENSEDNNDCLGAVYDIKN